MRSIAVGDEHTPARVTVRHSIRDLRNLPIREMNVPWEALQGVTVIVEPITAQCDALTRNIGTDTR